MIRLRIEYLEKYYNVLSKGKQSRWVKKQRKLVRDELMGYGVLMVRRKDVCVELPDGKVARLKIDGVMDTSFGNIIGYRCCDCGQVASIKTWKDYFHVEIPEYDMLGCNTCDSVDVEPIFDDYIIGKD